MTHFVDNLPLLLVALPVALVPVLAGLVLCRRTPDRFLRVTLCALTAAVIPVVGIVLSSRGQSALLALTLPWFDETTDGTAALFPLLMYWIPVTAGMAYAVIKMKPRVAAQVLTTSGVLVAATVLWTVIGPATG